MAAVLNEAQGLGAGEILSGKVKNISTYATFEDGAKVGHFLKLDTGSIDNLDGSATPVIAGVGLRKLTGSINDVTYTAELDNVIEVIDHGFVVVNIVSGNTPTAKGAVYAHNDSATSANYGKATTTSTNNVLVANAKFVSQIDTDRWLISIGLGL